MCAPKLTGSQFTTRNQTRKFTEQKLKTTRGHLMTPQQHLYNGLRPIPFFFRNGLARTDRVLAYVHRGWLAYG